MNKHLLILDYDGTLVDSFSDSPTGVNVHVAYERAVRDIYGEEGLIVYKEKLGGLQNRSPHELAIALLRELGKEALPLLPAVEKLVQEKLGHLVPEINESWPIFYPGVKEFFQSVREGEIPVDLAIVSSGHNEFIEQSFKVNNIPVPEILITSDIARRKRPPGREWYKPHTYQLAEGHRQWIRSNGEYQNVHQVIGGSEMFLGRGNGLRKSSMAYVGDDDVKDGGLAERSRIPFIHVPFVKPNFTPDSSRGQLSVEGFSQLHSMLLDAAPALRDGATFSQILLGRSDSELFPPLKEGERPYAKMMGASHNPMARR